MTTVEERGISRRRGSRFLTVEERLALHTKVSDDGCWEWQATLSTGGYGVFSYMYKNYSAHRVSYEQRVSPIPDGLVLDHLCRNRACINPEHLEPVTQRENTLRGVAPTTLAHLAGTCTRGHERSKWGGKRTTGGRVYCRLCRMVRRRANVYHGRPTDAPLDLGAALADRELLRAIGLEHAA